MLSIAEIEYQPRACRRPYRLVILRKEVAVTKGEQKLFDDSPFFFYITNVNDLPTAQIVRESNRRCDQENIIAQGKAMGAFAAPLNDLMSNWAYMVMATLAWNLKSWLGLLIHERCPLGAKEKRQADKRRVVRMDFKTFQQTLMQIPAQIIRTGRRIIYRLLTWTPSLDTVFRIHASLNLPLRQ